MRGWRLRWEDKERDGGVKDRDPVEIKMSACAEADAHLPGTHALTHMHSPASSQAMCKATVWH